MKSKVFRYLSWITILIVLLVLFFIYISESVVYAEGLVDETINSNNVYSMYPLRNYQLDFYVDNSWGWLPWNWTDGIGKSVQYGLYCITNFIWIISLYLSNATGYVVQEAYKLDFINDMADSIGKSIQTIAGINQNGISNSGFYIGFLLLFVLILGIYVAYTGLIKKETSKAINSVINFVVIFIISASFIAYAPDYIKKVNDFSSDISKAALNLGTKIVTSNSNSEGKDSINLIRDNLFSIQVQQPWMLLQYGNSNIEEIGKERVEKLLSIDPGENDGKKRDEIVKSEIEEKHNNNLTITEVMSRLGKVFFLLIFNIGITIFVFLLVSMMIFSQILFIIFSIFLPLSFLLSMIPSYESIGRQAIVKLFNTIMMRAGITLIITIAFSISTMFYTISTDYPFFMIAFLQIVTFAGIYMKLGDIMGMFSLHSGDSQNMSSRMFRKPYRTMRNKSKNIQRHISKALISRGKDKEKLPSNINNPQRNVNNTQKRTGYPHSRENYDKSVSKESFSKRIGNTVGAFMDTKKNISDKSKQVKENIKDIPVQAKYAVHNTKEKAKDNISDFKRGIVEEKEKRQQDRNKKQQNHRETIAQKRAKLGNIVEAKEKNSKDNKNIDGYSDSKYKPSISSERVKKKKGENIRPTVSEKISHDKNIEKSNSINKIERATEKPIHKERDIANQSEELSNKVENNQNGKVKNSKTMKIERHNINSNLKEPKYNHIDIKERKIKNKSNFTPENKVRKQ
ncbi:YtxH domain-containing protein [Clostridium botulinum]|uniref:YtxH domain-containing protein n=1 Tax=Clostridium botulinum TaxID=1491 RepID=A0A6G4CTS1_CLOBO|nr:YtxH domain-containing protein [Clostridium botulinum]NEZ98391.1 YtxH domain-containing protein [Clostridium botulinum]NFA30050.1 YtxH domain-containing protein [Clostridium botulinum]NFA86450.1 YtxH domain-containing protein [Clostridium botulinum]NFB05089.1 YtxH domain-containing protein [Clostridium botulinum]